MKSMQISVASLAKFFQEEFMCRSTITFVVACCHFMNIENYTK